MEEHLTKHVGWVHICISKQCKKWEK